MTVQSGFPELAARGDCYAMVLALDNAYTTLWRAEAEGPQHLVAMRQCQSLVRQWGHFLDSRLVGPVALQVGTGEAVGVQVLDPRPVLKGIREMRAMKEEWGTSCSKFRAISQSVHYSNQFDVIRIIL